MYFYNLHTTMSLLHITSILLGLIFIFYGYQCLFSTQMKTEFIRFQLTNNQRKWTGILQLTGALGLGTGVLIPWFGVIASAGLGLMMFLGFIVRLKIKDRWTQTFPSFFFMILAFIICYLYTKDI